MVAANTCGHLCHQCFVCVLYSKYQQQQSFLAYSPASLPFAQLITQAAAVNCVFPTPQPTSAEAALLYQCPALAGRRVLYDKRWSPMRPIEVLLMVAVVVITTGDRASKVSRTPSFDDWILAL